MSAFSTGVICQPLLALGRTKEVESAGEEKLEWTVTGTFKGLP